MSADYITKGELEEFVKLFPNAYDKMYCYLLYDGFTPEQIVGLRPGDILETGIIAGTEIKPVSECALEQIKAAIDQNHYYVYNHLCDGLIEKDLYSSPYIIKFPKSDKETDVFENDMDQRHRRMQRRLYRLQRERGVKPKFTEKGIYFSGLVAALIPLAEQYDNKIEIAYEHQREAVSEIIKRWKQTKWYACRIYNRFMGT